MRDIISIIICLGSIAAAMWIIHSAIGIFS